MLGSSVGGGRRKMWMGKRKVNFRGSGRVSGIGRRVIIKNCMGNQTNSMLVEDRDRKNFSFLEKWSRVPCVGMVTVQLDNTGIVSQTSIIGI
mgnify:CR=1 FL=1